MSESVVAACPRCVVALEGHALGAHEGMILSCPGCGGHWLDNLACQRLLYFEVTSAVHTILRAGPRRGVQAGVGGAYRSSARRGSDPDGPAQCVTCDAMTSSYVTDPKLVGVRVRLDVCAAHGTWFDRGEAWQLLQSVTLLRAAEGRTVADAAWSEEWLAQNAKFRAAGR